MTTINPRDLYNWCKVPYTELENHPERKAPFRLCADSAEMGQIMARELVDEIQAHNARASDPAIIPWPELLHRLFTNPETESGEPARPVAPMDECLARAELPAGTYTWRFMEGLSRAD
jgi:hypothetical protein